MASIDVHGNVGQVELLKSICNTITVTGGGVLAGLEVDVGDQVGKRIGLDDQGNGSVGVALEDSNNGWSMSVLIPLQIISEPLTVNVLGLVDVQLTNGKLTVGGLSSTITSWKIVDDQGSDLVAGDVLDAILNNLDLGTGIATI